MSKYTLSLVYILADEGPKVLRDDPTHTVGFDLSAEYDDNSKLSALPFKHSQQFCVRAADRLQSHFSLSHHADTVAALWLCVAVQSD